MQQALAALEARQGGRLGVATLDTASHRLITHRGDERFALCSTHKLLAARLDRREPALNEAAPGDPRDTTTPVAMLETIRKTVLGTALSPASRAQFIAWLVANKTGDKRLRCGVPVGWRVGDKTGSGGDAATNDVAVIWPPGRAPLIVTAYYAKASASESEREAVLSEIGRLAAS